MKYFRILALALCFCTIFSVTSFAFTDNTNYMVKEQITEQIKVYSREDFIARLTEVENGTIGNSTRKVAQIETSSKVRLPLNDYSYKTLPPTRKGTMDGFYTYHEYIITKNFGAGNSAEQGVLYIQYNVLSFRQITGIAAEWTGANASGPYTFSEYYHNYTYTGKSISQQARGAIEIAIDVSGEGGLEYKNKLLGVGFSVSMTIGTTCYVRKVESWSGKLSIY